MLHKYTNCSKNIPSLCTYIYRLRLYTIILMSLKRKGHWQARTQQVSDTHKESWHVLNYTSRNRIALHVFRSKHASIQVSLYSIWMYYWLGTFPNQGPYKLNERLKTSSNSTDSTAFFEGPKFCDTPMFSWFSLNIAKTPSTITYDIIPIYKLYSIHSCYIVDVISIILYV